MTLEDFRSRVSDSIELAREDSKLQRKIVETLDIYVTLAIEEGEKVMRLQSVVGEEVLSFINSPSGGAPRHRRPLLLCWQRSTLTGCCLRSCEQFPR